MSALQSIERALLRVGYRAEAVVPDYRFADVLAQEPLTRTAPLVAFARTPPSYRSAALGVLRHDAGDMAEFVRTHRALGAPFMLVIAGETVTAWQVRSEGPPQALETVHIRDLDELFARNEHNWHPDAIHRAKSIGRQGEPYQVDFIDLGLLPAIEGEIHVKLDRLLVECLDLARRRADGEIDPRLLFRIVFRLLAAKVLHDRSHPFASQWDVNDLGSVLKTIEGYYGLEEVDAKRQVEIAAQFEPAWQHLRAGISFSNVSADDLAFVYENTLITEQTRDLFGTHSTPRQLAEYIVQRLDLHEHRPEALSIYEPCTGAGVFLVSALRHLRDLLPDDWSDAERHAFLINHLAGDEIDPFACEVATLSLILADYPNHNGWHIKEVDLFQDGVLASRMAPHNVILCNPPFEAFNAQEKTRYRQAAQNVSKAIAVLSAAIDARPLALGFVLPRAFILEKQFAALRRRLEALYDWIEIVQLPDRIFGMSKVESAAIVAKHLRQPNTSGTHLISTEVADRDRLTFLVHGRISDRRERLRLSSAEPQGNLWIPALDAIWKYLENAPQLGSKLRPRWGMRWNYRQDLAAAETPRDGYRPGLLKVRAFQQYVGGRPAFLDFRIENLREGFNHDWSLPKLIMNAMRLRRGPWRIGAMVDLNGLLYSQQFFGLWPEDSVSEDDLYALCGILNGPIANAFLSAHAPRDRFRSTVVARIPIPASLPSELAKRVREYLALAHSHVLFSDRDAVLAQHLAEIDALTLAAYDLPPHLHDELERYFADASRPVAHAWPPDAPPPSGSSVGVRAEGSSGAASDLARVRRRIASSSAALRERFLAKFATIQANDPMVHAWGGTKRLRQWEAERRIFSVNADDGPRFPLFQFDEHGPKPVIADALRKLPAEYSGWEIALWFVSANPWLDAAAPLNLILEPDRLIDAAAQTAEETLG